MEYQSDLAGLGRYIRERRKQLHLTQEMLGRRLGWAQERVSTLENGKYGLPSLPQFCRLADALRVPLPELLRHAGLDSQLKESPQDPDVAASGQLRGLGEKMAAMIDRVQEIEGHLHQAERNLAHAEELQASVRERRVQMAELLAASREEQAPG
jgi:transcriptional regulator with XRE-family HTH domain